MEKSNLNDQDFQVSLIPIKRVLMEANGSNRFGDWKIETKFAQGLFCFLKKRNRTSNCCVKFKGTQIVDCNILDLTTVTYTSTETFRPVWKNSKVEPELMDS